MFDGAAENINKNGKEEMQLHISLIVDVKKKGDSSTLQYVCSAWLDRLEVQKGYCIDSLIVISMLGEFADICQSKQVNLEPRINSYTSIGGGLIDEAESIGASFLIVGGFRNPKQRSSLGIMKYCYKHASDDISVIVVGKSGQPPQHHGDSEFSASEVSLNQVQVGLIGMHPSLIRLLPQFRNFKAIDSKAIIGSTVDDICM